MTVRPASDQVLVEERRTRLESKEALAEKETIELWDFIDSLTEADWGSEQYRTRIERGHQVKSDDRVYVEQTYQKRTRDDIQRMHGGGPYTIWFYGPPKAQQLKYKKQIVIDGSPRSYAPANGANGSSYTAGLPAQPGDPIMQLVTILREEMKSMREELRLSRGGDATTRAVDQAVQLTGQVFSSATAAATQTLSRIADANHSAPAANPMNDLQTKLFDALLQKLLSPADPIKQFGEMMTAMKALGFGSPGEGAGNDNVAAKLALEGIRTLPQALHEGVKGLEQWRIAEELRFRTAQTMRGGPDPINVQPGPGTPPPPSPSAVPPRPPAAAAPPSPNGGVAGMDILAVIEQGLVNILNNQALTIEEAAHRAAALMEDMMPGMPDRVAAAGEGEILKLFQTRQVLQQVPQNPRLTEFIKKFIEVVRSAPVEQPHNSAAPPA